MTSGPTRGSAAAIVDDLRTTTQSIEGVIRKYVGVLDLRERQLSGAAAVGDAPRRSEALQETSAGCAADLTRYATELWPHVLAFDVGCAELQQCYSALHQHGQRPTAADAGGTVGDHIERLKMARASRDVAREARRAVEIQHALSMVAGAAVRQMQEIFDQYVSALDAFEVLSLEALKKLGADARSSDQGARER